MSEPNRPRPGPRSAPTAPQIPDGGIAVALPAPRAAGPAPHGAGTRGPGRRGGRRLRGLKRFARTRRGKWTIVSVVAVLALILGLLSKGFLSSTGDPLSDVPPAAGGTGELASIAPTPTTSASPGATPKRPATAEDIRKELQARAGSLNNPLNTLRSPGVHTVTISVRSKGSVNSVGYLIPTSINTNFAYGTKKVSASSFGFSTKAVGPGYLALIFVQSGATGAPVTCTVSIDGKATSTESTQGPYARQVCLG